MLRLAWREARASRRRLALLTASITAGVAALVAVNSFTDNLAVSVAHQAQALLGADLAFSSRQPAGQIKAMQRLLDSLRAVGGPAVTVATSANFVAMAYRPAASSAGGARLVQVRTVDPGWPFYGAITTRPAGIWPGIQRGGAVVDPSLLAAIGAKLGDTLALGDGRFAMLGTVLNVPGDIGLQLAFGPRVFIATSALPATGLLGFGARVDYETFVRVPPAIAPQTVAARYGPALQAQGAAIRTVADDRDNLTHRLNTLGSYLGLVALAALLLGGLGVASAVSVFIRQQLDTVAVLRTLGATAGQLFGVFLLQALAMGLLGSLLGALIGAGLQQLMPAVLHDLLPVDVQVVPSPRAMLAGIGLGIWTAGVFTLLPLLGIREVSPLATLRRTVDPPPIRWDILRAGAMLLLLASVVGLAAMQIHSLSRGAVFAVGCLGALGTLWLASLALVRGARRWTPASWPYLGRQGLANLHRPANQTLTVMPALGFGAFLLTTIFMVQHNLLYDIRVEDTGGARPNLALFDIQTAQRPLVDSVLHAEHETAGPFVAIVPMRIRDLRGRSIASFGAAADSAAGGRRLGTEPAPWALRREYRSTYRAEPGPAERVVAGRWFGSTPRGTGRTPADPVEISMEQALARDLGLGLGDRVTWDVQGVPVYSRITSLREVDWARFEPNFFVVFAPGALEQAPQSWATMVRVPAADARGRIERSLAARAANVTSVDLADLQHAIEEVIGRIVLAIRFMALFSLATGGVVLIGAIATSRWQRVREGTLLRTLGATRLQVLVILSVEYAALGLGAAITASLLASAAGWALATWLFGGTFVLPWASMLLLALGIVALTTVVGLWNSIDVLQRPPLEVLRSE